MNFDYPVKLVLTNLTCFAVVSSFSFLSSQFAFAQEDETVEEEVIVYGVRSALKTALDVKRNSENIVDAISSEDIGALPGISIAESLQLLPGVSGLDENGRIEEVGIRGLSANFTMTTLNGREVASSRGQRGVTLSVFPGELIEQALVYKTPLADAIEGGVAGTVELRTIRPLDSSRSRFSGNLRVENNPLGSDVGSEDNSYRGSFAYVDKLMDDRLGIAYAFSGRKGYLPAERMEVQNFNRWRGRNYANNGGALPRNPATNPDTGASWTQVQAGRNFAPALDARSVDYENYRLAREALNLPSDLEWVFPNNFFFKREDKQDDLQSHMLALQFKPNDLWDINFDGLISKSDADSETHEFRINQFIQAQQVILNNRALFDPVAAAAGREPGADPCDPVRDANGDVTYIGDDAQTQNAVSGGIRCSGQVFVEPIGIDQFGVANFIHVQGAIDQLEADGSGTLRSPLYSASNRFIDIQEESNVLGLNIVRDNGDLRFEADFSYSNASRDQAQEFVLFQANAQNARAMGYRTPDGELFSAPLIFDNRNSAFPLVTYPVDLASDDGIYRLREAQYRLQNSEDELSAVRLEIAKSFDEGTVRKIEAGIRLASREKNNSHLRTLLNENTYFRQQPEQTGPNAGIPYPDLAVINPADDGSPNFLEYRHFGVNERDITAPFLPELGKEIGRPFPTSWFTWEQEAMWKALFPGGQAPIYPRVAQLIPDTWTVEEETQALFYKVDFGGDFMGIPVSGGFGIRYIDTKATTTQAVAPIAAAFVNPVEVVNGVLGDTPIMVDIADTPIQIQAPQFLVSYPDQGNSEVDLGRLTNIERENEYSDFLPSLNVSFEVTPEFIVRFGWAKVMTRPTLSQLGGGLNLNDGLAEIDVETGGFSFGDLGAKSGNPFLEPFRANQRDLSFEYYFSDENVLAVGLFKKNVNSFINANGERREIVNAFAGQVDLTNGDVIAAVQDTQIEGAMDATEVSRLDIRDLSEGLIPTATEANVELILPVTSPLNGEGGDIKGIEVTYQQVLDFDSLPEWVRNFGMQMAYTYTEAEIPTSVVSINDPRDLNNSVEADTIANEYTLQTEPSNFSKRMLNAQVYWDNGPFSIRFAYSWRDAFNRGAIRQDERGQVNMSARYAVSDNIRISLQALNLFEEDVVRYRINPIDDIRNDEDDSHLPEELRQYAGIDNGYELNIPAEYQRVGRRVLLGISYNFD